MSALDGTLRDVFQAADERVIDDVATPLPSEAFAVLFELAQRKCDDELARAVVRCG